jgi:hypothetical protein
MLKVVIEVIDEKGVVLVHHEDNATRPTTSKLHPDHPVEDEEYKLFGITYQPHVMRKGKLGGF